MNSKPCYYEHYLFYFISIFSLAEEMGNKVGADESSIENVSIKTRPMTIADDYSNFCTNAWLDAKDILDEKFKKKYDEKDIIMFLFHVLQVV